MRTLIIMSWLVLVSPVLSYASGDTNEFTLFTSRVEGQKYEWRISDSRAIATPTWNPDSQTIPLSPDRAWQIARDWAQAHGYSKPRLMMVGIQEVHPPEASEASRGRFYYKVDCKSPKHSVHLSVVVLMDSTVLESRQVAEATQVVIPR